MVVTAQTLSTNVAGAIVRDNTLHLKDAGEEGTFSKKIAGEVITDNILHLKSWGGSNC